MKSKLCASPIFLLAVMFLIAACGEEEEGSGRLVTESRSLGAFTAVDVSEVLRAEITIGSPFAVEAEFDDNLLENLQIEVRGQTLHISCEPNCDPCGTTKPRPHWSNGVLHSNARRWVEGCSSSCARAGRIDNGTEQPSLLLVAKSFGHA